MGAGVGKRAAKVRWGTARTMLAAWLVTIPAAGSIAAVAYLLTDALGSEIAGPVVVSLLTSGVLALAGRDGGTPGTARRALGTLSFGACLALVALGLYVMFTSK